MKIILIGILTVLLLSACAPVLLTSNPRSVTIENAGKWNTAETQQMADDECAKQGRYAIHRPDNMRDGQATYECVE
tara:strand:+ start:2168 stop:2395 length:228 start_codon:yes stop_codon:yes gene_type:complete